MKIDSNGDSLWTIHYKGEYENLIRSVIALNNCIADGKEVDT